MKPEKMKPEKSKPGGKAGNETGQLNITIDGQEVWVAPGTTILQAAGLLQIPIPTLCCGDVSPPSSAGYSADSGHSPYSTYSACTTSCMVCLVRQHEQPGRDERYLPACSAPCEAGMVVDTRSPEVIRRRTRSLDLLLSEHMGDCEAPCELICPAGLPVPEILQLVQQKEFSRAALAACYRQTGKGTFTNPCRACAGRCGKVCRGREPLSIPRIMISLGAYLYEHSDRPDDENIPNNNLFADKDPLVDNKLSADRKPKTRKKPGFTSHRRKDAPDLYPVSVEGEPAVTLQVKPKTETVQPGMDTGEGGSRFAVFSLAEMRQEAERCLECHCLKAESCRLRQLACEHNISKPRYTGSYPEVPPRVRVDKDFSYEPGKCVKCGFCVEMGALCFRFRGTNTVAGLPEGETDELRQAVMKAAARCPTGALAQKKQARGNDY